MQCPYCHADDQDGRFCKKCGKPLNQDASDLTRVMPPLDALREPPDAENAQAAEAPENAASNPVKASASGPERETPETANENAEAETFASEAADATEETPSEPETAAEDAAPEEKPLPSFLLEEDESDAPDLNEAPDSRRKKILTALALVIGIALAAVAAVYLFTDIFDTTPPPDPSEQVKNADTIAPDTSLAEDTIVGHWRHYNTGSVIEKIGSARYRWTMGDDVYQLDFADNQYTYEDENGNTYTFVLTDADHIQLASSSDASGGLITDPIFENGYIAGRVGQDGTMSQSMRVNADAFNILGKTYAELAGTYGPGALSVIGDDQYIVFRAEGGNFAVHFEGETVPLKAPTGESYQIVPLSSNTSTVQPDMNTSGETSGSTTTQPDLSGNPSAPNAPNTDTSNDGTTEDDEGTEYTVEIPDMPTFPSTTAVATGVVWADLGFVIDNCPDTLSVSDLSAVLGIALEVGSAPGNESGFNFYGSDEGYFAGTYASGDHAFSISGYGNSALDPGKTMLFIQQIS